MGAFKNKTIVVHANDEALTYFFSTDHCQKFVGGEDFVPLSFYDLTMDEVRDLYFRDHYFTEIENPDPDCKP